MGRGTVRDTLDNDLRKAPTKRVRRFDSRLILELSGRGGFTMAARYATAIAVILCATAFSAFAGPVYEMVGGICTDGWRGDMGQLLCDPNGISVTVEMADWYVPGTWFGDSPQDPQSVALFTFYDGFPSYGYVVTGFPIDCCGSNSGEMGGPSDQDYLFIHWLDGPNFEAFRGEWFFWTPTGGDPYFSSGTYDYWVGPRAPAAEPQSLVLVSVALATLVLVRSRRSRVPIRA